MKTTLVLVVITSLMTVLCAVDTSKPFDLTSTTGETYKNCRISKVTPEAITVVHDAGVAKVSFTLLSAEWRSQFEYDPAKAQQFAKDEEEKRKVAEAKRAELNRKREMSEEEMLAGIAAAERKRLEAEAKAAQEYQEALKNANTPQTPLAPLPGDPTPNLGQPAVQPMLQPAVQPIQPILQTEVVIPTYTPVGDPYTPSRIRSRSFYYSGDYFPYGGYYPYVPIFSNPGCFHPVTPCPPSSSIPGVGGISIGGGSVWIR